MNILVRTCSGRCIVRPDTTWERDNEDVYFPEFVDSVSFTPVVFARICKPGRSVDKRFAERYYDSIGYGVLLYPDQMMDGSEEGFACASCLDHTSFLPFPLYDKTVLDGGDVSFELEADGNTLFSFSGIKPETICRSIEDATRFTYVRIGDLIAVELDRRKCLCTRVEAEKRVQGCVGADRTIDFRIIF